MRDKNRIPMVSNELERIWKANPDLRLGQLIVIGTAPKAPCLEVFYIEDDVLLEKLMKLDSRSELKTIKSKATSKGGKYTNISQIDPKELTLELLEKLIMKIKNFDKKIVITPINLMGLNGAPVSDQTWLLSQKMRVKKLKRLLVELKKSGVLIERKSKQDFLEIKEVGYDIKK